ncbi:uncharacterized protein LAESUDRAFT_656447, partial [Laetiporus sulphureus 93-53]
QKPKSRLHYVIEFLHLQGLRVQRELVRDFLHRVDARGQILHRHEAIQHQMYEITHLNTLWHCDGHHKLIWWGIVIHGFIDGYCRMVHFFPILFPTIGLIVTLSAANRLTS